MQRRKSTPWSQFLGRPMASWSWISPFTSRLTWASCLSSGTRTNWDTAWLEETLASNSSAFMCLEFTFLRLFAESSLKQYKDWPKIVPYPGLRLCHIEASILRMFCMRFKQLCDLPHCLLPVCGVWVLRNIHISTPLFTGWRIPRCSQGALYLLLSDMVIQLFRNGTPFFLPRCIC